MKHLFRLRGTLAHIANMPMMYCANVPPRHILTSGWTDKIGLGCHPVRFEDDPDLKMFFVLRKKLNQVSFLHVYHHISTIGIGYLGSKYLPGKLNNTFFFIEFTSF
uniref:Very-long-chain 3-oxoacyl-CoA synthase n=1 Tax=Timema shepardi TaxID=629360 RepID=A0A7R9FZD3_TIMSH|nr:unnamed protein product [Timema shepardi]